MIKNKNILLKEEEFIKLNEEIDTTTKDLMNQVDQIKELQLSNEKFYTEWSLSDMVAKINAGEKEHHEKNDISSSIKSFEDDVALKEYLSTRQDDSSNLEDSNQAKKPAENKYRKEFKQNSKSCQSAKIMPSVVGVQEEELLSLGIVRHKSDVRLNRGKVDNDVIPETLKGVGQDGIMRFLSAKVKLLTQQLEVIQKDEKKHLEKIKDLQTSKDKLTEEREKLILQINMSRSSLIKYEQHSKNVADQLLTVNTENSHLKKELETLKKEIRLNNKNHNASEIKLNRTLEESEKLKSTLQQMKQEEKEYKEIHRRKVENLTNVIKKLDRQRTELLNGFKKQLIIIDNLKRQKDLIEARKLLDLVEVDFDNYLDSNPTNTVRSLESLKLLKS